jgi:predicted AAA+ superfamily ATPase
LNIVLKLLQSFNSRVNNYKASCHYYLIAEQFVSQHLAYMGGPALSPELFYWLRDKSANKSEVDFVFQHNSEILAVEVKATSLGHMKSLLRFISEKSSTRVVKISLAEYNQKTYEHKVNENPVKLKLLEIPHFAIESLPKIISQP